MLSCDSKKESKTEAATSSISFEMKTYRVESPGGCASDTLACASYEISYPVFSGISAGVLDSIKRKIDAAVDTGNPEKGPSPFEEAGKVFVSDFDTFHSEFPEGTMGWYYNAQVTVEVHNDTLISMSVNNEFFTGGAHGGYGTYFINIDPRTGSDVLLKDILKAGYEPGLNKIGEEIFRKTQEISDTVSLADSGYEFSDGLFKLNSNYGITSEGILFVFNIYEIAPYALGSQEVLIPFERLKDLLR